MSFDLRKRRTSKIPRIKTPVMDVEVPMPTFAPVLRLAVVFVVEEDGVIGVVGIEGVRGDVGSARTLVLADAPMALLLTEETDVALAAAEEEEKTTVVVEKVDENFELL